MFPRDQRIRRSDDILSTLRRGRRAKSGVVTCFFLRKPGNLTRVTVIVDTKVSKQAVIRNLLKRRTRALLRTTPLPQGDLIVRLWRGAADLSFEELQLHLNQCLKNLV